MPAERLSMSKKQTNKTDAVTLWRATTLSDFTPELTKDLFERSYGDITLSLNKFLDINRKAFDFLGITAMVEPGGGDRRLHLSTSQYGGVIPLRGAGSKSKPILFSVTGRFGEDVTDLMPLLSNEVCAEFETTLSLPCESPLQPPIYLECFKLINQYLITENTPWHKFDTISRNEPYVAGMTDWTRYAIRTDKDPQSALNFPNRRNILQRQHEEQQKVNYALSVALSYLSAANPSPTLLAANDYAINRAVSLLRDRKVYKCDSIPRHSADSDNIRVLKEYANNVLNHSTADRSAWRINQSEFFERYVQYICRQVSMQTGMLLHSNRRLPIHGPHTPWGMSYLEPDIVMEHNGKSIVLDAKYKGHLIYGSTHADILATEYRHDLHQLLAYSAITNSQHSCLVYPSDKCRHIPLTIEERKVSLIGVPISRLELPAAIHHVASILIRSIALSV